MIIFSVLITEHRLRTNYGRRKAIINLDIFDLIDILY